LKRFSEAVLAHVNEEVDHPITYDEVMLIDGNDERGIDVGIMTRGSHRIHAVESHVDDLNSDGERIFSRDSPVYNVVCPGGTSLSVIPNHFKSKFGGDSPESRERRRQQAKRVADIYRELVARGILDVVILGDLNDTPDSRALAPLLVDTDLKDVSTHPRFDTGEFEGKGTYGLGNDSNKIDYLLLSPTLFARVTACGLFRKGAWPGRRPKRWSVYEELTAPLHAASDHHVIWADLDI
jgi:endonuclease/exonuclease/phosphatase family metal-dependent hydrolase